MHNYITIAGFIYNAVMSICKPKSNCPVYVNFLSRIQGIDGILTEIIWEPCTLMNVYGMNARQNF